jgi:membrane protein required for colicin V production
MPIDLIYAAILIIACFKGYRKGLVVAVFSVAAFILGIAAALKLSAVVAVYLQGSVNVSTRWIPFVSFVLVFLVVVLLVRLGSKLVEKTFQFVLLGWVNRLGGILLYAALYSVVFSIFIFYAEKLELLKPSLVQGSQCYPWLHSLGPKLIGGLGKLIPVFKDMFSELEAFFSSLSDKIAH